MTLCLFAVPGDLDAPTGGYAYARKLLQHWPGERGEIKHLALPDGFPSPSQAEIEASVALIAGAAEAGARAVVLIDGLAYGAMPEDAIRRLPLPLVALVHHPLGLETGLDAEESAALLASEALALALAAGIVATSGATARAIQEIFNIEAGRIAVAEPGVERAARAAGSQGDGGPLHIVSAGAITPRKGFDVLIEALGLLRELPWRATIAGSLDRDPITARQVRDHARLLGFDERIRFTGAVSEAALAQLYHEADMFALATHYEGYGMVFTEAMARGLPIVCSGGGAVRETVPEAAGLHVEAGDPHAFAAALRRMLEDEAFRRACGNAAFAHAQSLPDWNETARRVAAAVERASA